MPNPTPPINDDAALREREQEIELALLGFRGGYGGHSLTSIMQLIRRERQAADRAAGMLTPELYGAAAALGAALANFLNELDKFKVHPDTEKEASRE